MYTCFSIATMLRAQSQEVQRVERESGEYSILSAGFFCCRLHIDPSLGVSNPDARGFDRAEMDMMSLQMSRVSVGFITNLFLMMARHSEMTTFWIRPNCQTSATSRVYRTWTLLAGTTLLHDIVLYSSDIE